MILVITKNIFFFILCTLGRFIKGEFVDKIVPQEIDESYKLKNESLILICI